MVKFYSSSESFTDLRFKSPAFDCISSSPVACAPVSFLSLVYALNYLVDCKRVFARPSATFALISMGGPVYGAELPTILSILGSPSNSVVLI